jgi:hypothetical protein
MALSRRAAIPLAILLALSAVPLRGQTEEEMPVPVEAQVPLLLRLLRFDRNLPQRAVNGVLSIGVVYQPRLRASVDATEGFIHAVAEADTEVGRWLSLRCVGIPWEEDADLDSSLAVTGVRVLYIAPLRAANLRRLVSLTQARQVLTLTGVPDLVRDGVAVGVDRRGGRPLLVIRWPEARAEGASFSAKLALLKSVKILP